MHEKEAIVERDTAIARQAALSHLSAKMLFMLGGDKLKGTYHDLNYEIFDLPQEEQMRLLNDLIDKGLAEYRDGAYTTTERGEKVNKGFTSAMISQYEPHNVESLVR